MSNWLNFFNIFKTCTKNEEGCYGKKRRPLRTITIFINTHGLEYTIPSLKLSSKIKNSHTIVHPTGKKGVSICSEELYDHGHKHDNYFEIIPYLKHQYKLTEESPVVTGNKQLATSFKEAMLSPSQSFNLDESKEIFIYNPKRRGVLPEEQEKIDKKHEIIHPENNNLRQLSYDKNFSVGDDNLSNKMGIFIIAVNNVREDSEYGYLNELEDWRGEVTDSIMFDRPIRPILKHQGNNLLIEHVYNQFYEFCMENSPKRIVGMPIALSKHLFTKKYHAPKFSDVLLSSIIKMFRSIGFEHVNIIDATCRSVYREDLLPSEVESLVRQHSEEEIGNYEDWEKEASVMGTGRRTKRRKRGGPTRRRQKNAKETRRK